MMTSRIPNFHQLSVAERLDALLERGFLSEKNYQALKSGHLLLSPTIANKMVENVIGVIGLPVGLALNFVINKHEYIIPLAVEEPSVVAALSSAAKSARWAGGFSATLTDSMLIGQIQVVSVPDRAQATTALLAEEQKIIEQANSLHPRMVARGGGAQSMEVREIETEQGPMLVVHLLVDTKDAMGANLVNTMCEGVAPLIETLTGGRVVLRILSNLTDRALVRAQMRVATEHLKTSKFTGAEVRDGIIAAAHFAAADPYRATTHNKGIMNGIDAVAIATGNDWRALESAAHAYAARSGRYSALTRFSADKNGDLIGEIEIPIKVGTVGANLQSNPMVSLNLDLIGTKSARTLAEIMGAVGLAQNFSALRALTTEGIQQGHMSLHARSVANTAKVPPPIFEEVVEALIAEGEVKVWKAEEIAARLTNQTQASPQPDTRSTRAFGKVILLGEHAAVYGRRVLAAPVPLEMSAQVERPDQPEVALLIADWQIHFQVALDAPPPESGYGQLLFIVLAALGLSGEAVRVRVQSVLPRAMGLGSSAALAVTIIRALDVFFKLSLSDEQINAIAYRCESLVHGHASGVDNTVATYGKFICFQKSESESKKTEPAPQIKVINVAKPLYFVLASTGVTGSTAESVGSVRQLWKKNSKRYESIFNQIEDLTDSALKAIEKGEVDELGELMNICQGYLNAIQVSSPEIERLVHFARSNQALGAKLTGGGLGGSVLSLHADENCRHALSESLQSVGYETIEFNLQ